MSRLLLFRGTWTPGSGFVADTRPGRVVHGAAGGSAEWGDITGLLIDQTDLQDALDDKEDAGTAAAAVAAHAAAANPHPVYLTQAEGDGLYDALGAASAAIAAHLLAGDPHPQYLTAAEGAAAYQPLDATLTALAGLNGTAGVVEQTGADTFTKRAIGAASSTDILTRADGDTRYPTLAKARFLRGAAFVGGGSSAIVAPTNDVAVTIPVACTIKRVRVLTQGGNGNCSIDVWKDTYANFPPTVVDSIVASAKPAISAAAKYEDATLTGWTTSVSAGDTLIFHLESSSTFTYLAITLELEPV